MARDKKELLPGVKEAGLVPIRCKWSNLTLLIGSTNEEVLKNILKDVLEVPYVR